VRVPPPSQNDDDKSYARAFAAVSEIVDGAAETVAAVIVEPLVQGAVGMRMYPAKFLRDLAALCTAHEVLWIADEVFTGYGRSGSMWACEQATVTPDLLCTAKGFTGGMLPMAATLVTERVFSAFAEEDRMLFHGHSFGGNPLGAAVAREVLAIYRDERILERAQPKAKRIAAAFDKLGQVAGVVRTRALGMVGAADLASSPSYSGHTGWQIYEEALKRGAYLRPLGDTVYIAPPLTISDDELDELLGIVEASIRARSEADPTAIAAPLPPRKRS
jgi:adenosylmethionine-8-amino-7-oxononanoate aminotransferase